MPGSTKSGPHFEGLLKEVIWPEDKRRHAYDFEIGVKEYGAIGYVLVHWAFLEFAVHYRTTAFAKRAKVPLPANARSFSFSRRLRVLRQLMAKTIRDPKSKDRWLELLSRIGNAEGRRHRIAHGLWSYNPKRVEQLWAYSANTKARHAMPFDVQSLGEFGLSVGELSYELLHPRPGSGRPPKAQDGPSGYVSRQFRLMLEGKDPAGLGFPEPIRAELTSSQETPRE